MRQDRTKRRREKNEKQKSTKAKKKNRSKRPTECMPTSVQTHPSDRSIHQRRQRVRQSDTFILPYPSVAFFEISTTSATGRVASRAWALSAILQKAPRRPKMIPSLPISKTSLKSTHRGGDAYRDYPSTYVRASLRHITRSAVGLEKGRHPMLCSIGNGKWSSPGLRVLAGARP